MRMSRRLIELLFVVLLLQSGSLVALQGEVRFFPSTDDAVWAGQELELNLELWTNGFSFADQHFVLPEVRGAFLLQADASTLKLGENRQGESWQGLRYTLLLYPQRAGRLVVPSFSVSFSSRLVFGTEPESFEFRTGSLEIPVRLPPGADPEGLLVTTGDFAVEYDWQPQANADNTLQLEVGDAISLEVRRSALAVPGMVFEPLPALVIPGLAVYSDAPQVEDRVNRGVLKGYRKDRVTFVCEQEGRYLIPEIKFQYWDPGRDTLGESTLPELELEVRASAAWGSGAAGRSSRESVRWAWLVSIMVLITLAVFPGRWLAGRLITAWRHWQARWREGEPWAYWQALSACRKARAVQAYTAISLWLGRCEGAGGTPTILQWARSTGDGSLLREACELQACISNGRTEQWRGRKLARLLRAQRARMRRHSRRPDRLSSLNP
jgi:hypothetical protein